MGEYMGPFPRDNLRRQQWLNAPRRSELLVNMEPVMVLPSVKPSKRWKSPSTLSTSAHSAAKHEALGCWYLEMWHQKLPYRCRRRCLDLLDHCCCLSSISHQKIERNEGLVKMFFILFSACVSTKKKSE